VTAWAKDDLKSRLSAAAAEAPMDAEWRRFDESGAMEDDGALALPLTISVTSVASLEGNAHVLSSRGATKRFFEFSFDLEWEAKAVVQPGEEGAEKAKTYQGKLAYVDVASAANLEPSLTFKKRHLVSEKRLRVAADALKSAVATAIHAFSQEFDTKGI